MQPIQFTYNQRGIFTWNSVLLILVLLCFSINGYAQKKLTDSLVQRKADYESRPGFKATDTNYIKTLYELGRSYIYQIPDSTKSISEQVLKLSKPINFEKGIAGGKLGLGLYHITVGEFAQGFEHLQEAEEKSKTLNAKKLLLKCINTKALGQFMRGNYPEAYLECKKGEKRAAEMGDLEMQVFFSMNLATCFAILSDYQQALPYYEHALQLVGKSNDHIQKAQIESNLGYMYLHTHELEKAKEYCTRAIKVLQQEQFQAWESFAWTTLGEVATREKNYDQALEHFTRSEALLGSIEDMQRKAETAQGFANVYYLKNDFDQSLEYALTAEQISKDIKYHRGIVKSSELLYKLFIEKGRPKEALDYLSTAKHLSDSILESENRTKFLMLETQAKFDREKKLAEFENEKKLAKQKTFTHITVVLLSALLVIGVLVRSDAVNQKRANQSLKELNKTKDRLFTIIGHDLKAPIGTLQELLALHSSKEISEQDIAQLAPRLKQNVDHSSFTLNNLLFWAKSQMNGISPDFKKVHVKEKLKSVCETYVLSANGKNLEIQCPIDPNMTIWVDPMHFEIILRNIVSNAIKYSSKGGSININCNSSPNGMVEIQVCDDGVGMSKSIVNAIMQNKTIESSPGTIDEKGTGLGLQIVKYLMNLNGGNFKIESNPNQGTCIQLYFKSV